jgi:hypothetical protein
MLSPIRSCAITAYAYSAQCNRLQEMAMADVIYVDVRPAERPGRFWGLVAGRDLTISRQPFLDVARVLLREGVDSSMPLVMRWTTTGTESLRSTVGQAAKLTVEDNNHHLRFRLYMPHS